MNARKKRLLLTTIVSVVSLLILSFAGFIYVHYNLLTYQTYYAEHMPHGRGTNPEMVLLLDRLDYVGDLPIEGVRYDTDGHNAIIRDKDFILRQVAINDRVKYEISLLNSKRDEIYCAHLFDNSGKFVSYYYQRPYEHKDIYEDNQTRKQEAQTYIDEVIDPIVKKMYKKPTINLQWIFNWKYEKRFSGD